MKAIFPFYHTLTGNLMGRIRCPADGRGCAQLAKAGYLYDLVEHEQSETENWIGSPLELIGLAVTVPNKELEYLHDVKPALTRTRPGAGQ
jgi:hypothetical protein